MSTDPWGPYKKALSAEQNRRFDHAKGLHRGSKADVRCWHCFLDTKVPK